MVTSLFSAAQNTEVDKRKKQFNLSDGNLGVGGYNVVSYFTG